MTAALSDPELQQVRDVFDLEQDHVLTALLTELQAIRLLNQSQLKLLWATVVALISLAGGNVALRFLGA